MFPVESRCARPDLNGLRTYDTSSDAAARRSSANGAGPGPAGTYPECRELVDLRRKIETLPVIEQAKGMLMGYLGVDAEVAFKILRRWSMRSNVKLSVICAELVAAASRPTPEPFGGLRAEIARVGSGPTPSS